MTVRHGTNSLKLFDDLETPTNFRQDYYAVTKNNILKKQEKHSTDMERIIEHIVNIILEIALLNPEIDIKVNNLVKVHFNKLEELKENKIKEE